MSEMNPNPRSGMSSAMVPCIVMPPGLRVDAAGGVPSWACAAHGTPSAGTRERRKHRTHGYELNPDANAVHRGSGQAARAHAQRSDAHPRSLPRLASPLRQSAEQVGAPRVLAHARAQPHGPDPQPRLLAGRRGSRAREGRPHSRPLSPSFAARLDASRYIGACHPEGGTHALRSQARFAQGRATEGSATPTPDADTEKRILRRLRVTLTQKWLGR